MENGYPGGVATLTAFTGGATSSFASDSDIVTNGDTYEHIRHANAKFIETANKLLEHFEPNERCPLPRLGETVFHVRTDAGISYQFAETRDLP